MPDKPAPSIWMRPYQRTRAEPGYVGQTGDYGEPDPTGAMDLARAHMEQAMPQASAAMRSLQPMDAWDRRMADPSTLAQTTSPGQIRYRPENLPADISSIDDLLAHELTHVAQEAKTGYLRFPIQYGIDSMRIPYRARGAEKEAYEVEARRRGKRRDIDLPSQDELHAAILRQLERGPKPK